MTETFRIRRFYRNLGIAGLVCFGGIALALVSYVLVRGINGPQETFVVGAAAVNVGWAAMSALSLLAYARELLTFTGASIIKTGVLTGSLGTVEIRLEDLASITWTKTRFSGKIVLRTNSKRMVVNLWSFDPDAWGRITRLLRLWAPPAYHRGWESFCYKVALPRREQDEGRQMRGGEMLLTRRIFFWTYSSAILLSAAVVAFRGWRAQRPEYVTVAALVALGVVVPWPLSRFEIPKNGIRIKSFLPRSRIGRIIYYIYCALALISTLVIFVAGRQMRLPAIVVWILVAMWGLVALVAAYPFFYRSRRDYQRHVDAAAEEWERLERVGGAAT